MNTCGTGSNTIAEGPNCAGGSFIEALDRRFNSAAAPPGESIIEPDLKPMQEQEFQIGLNHELSPQMVVGAPYIYQDLIRTIEDVGILVPGIGEVYYIANPGEGVTLELGSRGVPDFPKAKREYQGLELTFQKRYSDNWALFLSYTISRLYGNYSGLASSDENGRTSPNVNRFFDHIENSFDRDPHYCGRGHRPARCRVGILFLAEGTTAVGRSPAAAGVRADRSGPRRWPPRKRRGACPSPLRRSSARRASRPRRPWRRKRKPRNRRNQRRRRRKPGERRQRRCAKRQDQ